MSKAERQLIPINSIAAKADVALCLQRLASKVRFACLSTLSPRGSHLCLIAFALTPDLDQIVFATPKKTVKYANILLDPRVSILISSIEGPTVMDGESVSLDGRAGVVRRGGSRHAVLSALLLAAHPELKDFLAAETTALVAMDVEISTHVDHFQRVSVLDSAGDGRT